MQSQDYAKEDAIEGHARNDAEEELMMVPTAWRGAKYGAATVEEAAACAQARAPHAPS